MRSDAAVPQCELCHDGGWITVPHFMCVYHGRLVCGRGSKGIFTLAVACDNRVNDGAGYPVACPAGAGCAATGSITWGQYTMRIGGHDGVAMLTEYLDQKVADARARTQPGGTFPELYAELLERVGLVPA